MRYSAFLVGRHLVILDQADNEVFTDFLYYRDDMASADRVMKMYGYSRTGEWRAYPVKGMLVCDVEGEEKKVP